MAGNKKKTAFFCQECGFESAKWTGQCPSCKAWNSMVEEPVRITAGGRGTGSPKGLSLIFFPDYQKSVLQAHAKEVFRFSSKARNEVFLGFLRFSGGYYAVFL